MANEFKHKSVGTDLTQAEWEGTDTHEADSETANDMIYFNGTSWIRATAATIWAILDSEALDDTAVNGETTEGITSNWAFDHDADTDAHHAQAHEGNHVSGGSDAIDSALAIGAMPTGVKAGSITFIIDGGGVAITTGQKGHLEIPFACTISRVTSLADQSGSIVVDIWKDTYANFPPTDADSITASAPPTITTAQNSQDSTLTGWTTSISADDILAFNVDSCTTITRVMISLKVTKT